MIIPRIGAVILLIGFGFAVAQIGRFMYVVAREGYTSWIAVALFLAPTGILGLASALLVLWRKRLGVRLAVPFCVLLGVTVVITFFDLPPVRRFLDDYEQAALARGAEVPPYLAARGMTAQEYVASETHDVRAQGALGAIGAIVVYGTLVLRGSRSRPKPVREAKAKA